MSGVRGLRVDTESSSWESFCVVVFVVGGLTSVLMADDRLLINVLIGTRVVPFGVLRRVGSWWQLEKVFRTNWLMFVRAKRLFILW